MKRLILAVFIISYALIMTADEKKVDVKINKDECIQCRGGEMEGPGDTESFDWKFGDEMIPNLSDEQEKDIQKIRFDLQKNIIDIDASIKKAEIDMIELIFDDAKLDKLNKKIEEIGKFRTDIEKKRIEAFLKVRERLDKEQKDALNEIGLNFFGIHKDIRILMNVIRINDDNQLENEQD